MARIDASWPSWKPRSARCRCWRSRPTASRGSARAARTTRRPWCPKARAPWPASAATSWRPGWTVPPSASPRWAARACRGSARQPFTGEKHVFANLGDGTYFHSGLLAIRQSIAAGVNITYKILYNDAVAMTGGQQVGERPEGHSVLQIAAEPGGRRREEAGHRDRRAREVRRREHPGAHVAVKHRDELDRSPARVPRDRGHHRHHLRPDLRHREAPPPQAGHGLVDPAKRVVINDLVCEGCGDCSVKSNCLSVEPLETEFGRKRTINQSSCNKDMSCLKGFCPSFVTVEGGKLKGRPRTRPTRRYELGPLPEPAVPALAQAPGWASWSPVSAARASSPSASCWAWRRTSRARASSRRTRPAWPKRGAPPGATC
jgi:hypothetical protein